MESDEDPTREVDILSRPMGPKSARLFQDLLQKAIEPNRNDLLDYAAVDYEDYKERPPLPQWYHHWAVGIGEEKAFRLQADTGAKKSTHGWPIFWQEVSSKYLEGTQKIYLGRTTLTDEEIRVKGGTLPFEPYFVVRLTA